MLKIHISESNVRDIEGVEVNVDDLLCGENKTQHDARLTEILQIMSERNPELNKDKS